MADRHDQAPEEGEQAPEDREDQAPEDREDQAPEQREDQAPEDRQEAPEQREEQAPEDRQEAPEGIEPACLLCQRSEADPDICGQRSFVLGLCVHKFCLFFVSNSPDRPVQRLEYWNIHEREIPDIVSQAARRSCCICGQRGATIPCWARHCDLSFHLPCAKQGGCVTEFMPPYRAFCPTHSPEQAVEATPEPGTECLICLEPVEDRKTFNTLVCPACKTAWFHRDCIQRLALHDGILSIRCPVCRNCRTFHRDMFTMGIRIPFRLLPPQEDINAFAEFGERHRHCDASECLCPGGRQEAEEEGPWELLLCSSCAAEGTHRHCSGLRNSITRWECDGCAGLGTSSRDDSGLGGVSVARQSELEPSDSSRESETISPNTGCLALSGLSPSSPALETVSPSTSAQLPSLESSTPETSNIHTTQQATSEQSLQSPSQETSSYRSDRQVTSGLYHSSFPETKDSSCSHSQGSDHRNHSRRQDWAQNPHVRSRSPHDRNCVTAPSAGSRTTNQEASGTSRRQNRSRLQCQTQNPHVRSRRRHDRNCVTAPSTGSRTPSQEASGTSRRQNRSRLQRQTQNRHVQSRSPHDRNFVRAPSAGSCTPSQEASGASRRRNRSRLQRQTPNPSGRSRNLHDRNRTPAPSAGRQSPRETAARTSQSQHHSRKQRRTLNSSRTFRSRRDRSRVRASSAGSPTHRSDGETGTHH